MRVKLPVLALTLALAASAAHASASDNNFELYNGKKKTATATFSIDKGKKGLHIKSSTDYAADSLGQRMHDYHIGTDGIIDDATISLTVDQTLIFYKPNKTNDQLSVQAMKKNVPAGSFNVPMQPPDLIVAFNDDPSVWQVLLQVTADHPHDNRIYSLFIPGKTLKDASRIEPYILNAPADASGTLDGKTIALKHYRLQFNAGMSDIYTDTDGNLMQAEIAPLNIRHTRTNFALAK